MAKADNVPVVEIVGMGPVDSVVPYKFTLFVLTAQSNPPVPVVAVASYPYNLNVVAVVKFDNPAIAIVLIADVLEVMLVSKPRFAVYPSADERRATDFGPEAEKSQIKEKEVGV